MFYSNEPFYLRKTMEEEKKNVVSAKEIEDKMEKVAEEKNVEDAPSFPALSAKDMAVGGYDISLCLGQGGDSSHSLSSESFHILCNVRCAICIVILICKHRLRTTGKS